MNELYTITQGTTVANYQYSGGQRLRKYVDKGSIKEERIYLGSYEIYRKFDHTGSLTIERTTVHVSDDTGRIAMLETRTQGNAGDDNNTAETLTRYIYSNHLQSASLELDESAEIISYEEYHPYGTTSYQANNAAINAVAKRYRYTGKERDEESGLYYHSARYYIPWLARWSACDFLESKYAGMSPYNYGFNNPVKWTDSTGMAPDDIVTDTEKPKKPPKLDPPKPKEEYAKKAIELNPVEIKGDKLTSTESKASAAAMGLGLVLSEEVIGAIAAIFSEIIIPALIIVAIAYVLYRLFKEYLPHEKIWTKDETGTGEGTSTAEGTETDGGEGEEEQPMPSPNPDKPRPPVFVVPDEPDDDDIIYRGGSASDINFTPKMSDVGAESDPMSGLSFYDNPIAATNGEGGKYQKVSKKALERAGFIITPQKTSKGIHYGVRPQTQEQLIEWAKTKEPLKTNPELVHPLTKLAQSAIRGSGRIPSIKK